MNTTTVSASKVDSVYQATFQAPANLFNLSYTLKSNGCVTLKSKIVGSEKYSSSYVFGASSSMALSVNISNAVVGQDLLLESSVEFENISISYE